MTTKHTPGPWKIGALESGQAAVDGADGSEVTGFISIPDAHLIAAAPDLLEALEDMLGHCQGCNGKGRCYGPVPGSPGSYASNQPCGDCADARAAIAKARGSQ